MYEWLIPVLTLITGALGGYLGASSKVTVLQTQMSDVLSWKKETAETLAVHNEDLIIHDVEIGRLMDKNDMHRASRQIRR